MEKRTREIIALALLVVLGVGVAGAMAWYILVGHNWNYAAVQIDDHVGDMEEYTVIVYGGVLPKGSDIAAFINIDSREAKGGKIATATAKEVADSYRDKGADVIVLDTSAPQMLREPSILWRGGVRVGVFSVESDCDFASVIRDLSYLKRHNVDRVIVVAEDRGLTAIQYADIDLMVFTRDTRLGEGGTYGGRTFLTDCPGPGKVRVAIVSPNNMISVKTLAES